MTELVGECAREEERLMVSRLCAPISALGMESRRSALMVELVTTGWWETLFTLGMDRRRWALLGLGIPVGSGVS